jgi:hypothetical protein
MSWALGIHTGGYRLYQGWFGTVPEGHRPPAPETQHQKWTRNEWKALGEGDNLSEAIAYTAGQQDGEDPGYFAPIVNFRTKQEGFLRDITLDN